MGSKQGRGDTHFVWQLCTSTLELQSNYWWISSNALCQHVKRCTIICINMQIVIINILLKFFFLFAAQLGYVIFLVCHQSFCLHRALMSVCVDFSQNLHIYSTMLYIVIVHYFWKIRIPNALLPRSKKNTKTQCLQMARQYVTRWTKTHRNETLFNWDFQWCQFCWNCPLQRI